MVLKFNSKQKASICKFIYRKSKWIPTFAQLRVSLGKRRRFFETSDILWCAQSCKFWIPLHIVINYSVLSIRAFGEISTHYCHQPTELCQQWWKHTHKPHRRWLARSKVLARGFRTVRQGIDFYATFAALIFRYRGFFSGVYFMLKFSHKNRLGRNKFRKVSPLRWLVAMVMAVIVTQNIFFMEILRKVQKTILKLQNARKSIANHSNNGQSINYWHFEMLPIQWTKCVLNSKQPLDLVNLPLNGERVWDWISCFKYRLKLCTDSIANHVIEPRFCRLSNVLTEKQ